MRYSQRAEYNIRARLKPPTNRDHLRKGRMGLNGRASGNYRRSKIHTEPSFQVRLLVAVQVSRLSFTNDQPGGFLLAVLGLRGGYFIDII
jgi:hypothetical protein